MPNGDLEGDVAAIAEAEKVGLLDLEMFQERCGVVGRLLERERSLGDVGSPTVPLLIEGNGLPGLGQVRQYLGERGLDGRAAAVQQDQRRLSAALPWIS